MKSVVLLNEMKQSHSHIETSGRKEDPLLPEVIEFSIYQELKETLKDIFPELISTFARESEAIILKMEQACKDKDVDKIAALAHSLRSSSASIGAMKLSFIAWQIEKKIKDANPKELSHSCEDIVNWDQSWHEPIESALHNSVGGLVRSLRYAYTEIICSVRSDILI